MCVSQCNNQANIIVKAGVFNNIYKYWSAEQFKVHIIMLNDL
jgi:hypothetical protein